ncbi:MAG TPA: ABC transporter permease [Cyclobacteriaceae bacterium]|nr:ABC transporter permease [Cyclobacteriaceae bacterium]
MIAHYIKLAGNLMIRNKFFAIINVFGLVCGMLSALAIAKYIGYLYFIDSFHTNKNNIFIISQQETAGGIEQEIRNITYWGVGDLLYEYPEIDKITRYSYHVESLVMADGENNRKVSFIENKIFAADSNFLRMFSFPLIYGNAETALARDNSIVLTKSLSTKYFEDADPVGKSLTIRVPWGEERTYTVTGVAADLPRNSRFNFGLLISQNQFNTDGYWFVPEFSTFLTLRENTNTSALAALLTKHVNEQEPLKSEDKKITLSIDGLTKVRLSNQEFLLASVGIFIIILSWANYINQVIAQSYRRVKEFGILRTMGSTRGNLVAQFIVESGLICMASFLFTVMIYFGIEPVLKSLAGGHLLPLSEDPSMINFFFPATFIMGLLIAASIQSSVVFSQKFTTVLRNRYTGNIGTIGLRKSLVVMQFSISTVMMIGAYVIMNQLEYMTLKDKGLNMEDILVIRAPLENDAWEVKRSRQELFKVKCVELPFVSGISSSTIVPGEEYRHESFLSLQGQNEKALVYLTGVDDHFLDLYDVKYIAGHNFIPEARWKNRNSIILNESAARALGIVDPAGSAHIKITDHESNKVYDLIGIVKDFHQTSLKYEIKPMAFQFELTRGHFSLKLNRTGFGDDHIADRIAALTHIWKQIYQDAVFDYYYLDERFRAQDSNDHFFGTLFEFFTTLSIIISCLGLFGLSLIVSMKRRMEIGIRKVFGATSFDILSVFLKGYLGTLCISVLIGTPPAIFLMNVWLRNYSYRIEIGLSMVSLAIFSLALIFLFTISFHTIKSSLTNPVTILRD